jgi:hypothetical protein
MVCLLFSRAASAQREPRGQSPSSPPEKHGYFFITFLKNNQKSDCRSIQFNWVPILWDTAKEEVATSMAVSFWCREVLRVRMNIESHVRGTVPNNRIWMCLHVIKKLIDTFYRISVGAACCQAFSGRANNIVGYTACT